MSALRRDHHRQRRRRRHARPPPRARRASGSCCSSAATGCRASRRTGRPRDVFVDNRYISPDTWYDADGKPFQPQVHYFVGGATKLYGAALYRLRAEDFGELRHHDGISPAWPIGYDEMEPYYTQAEQLYQVHGARGEDPTEPPASAPYPFPRGLPRAAHPAALRRPRRRRAAPVPRALRGHARRGATCPTARACAAPTCDGFPCLVHAKSDAEVLGVRPALEHPNVTLLTERRGGAAARPTPPAPRSPRSWSSATARARRSPADIVVVSCGAANSRQAAARLGQRQAPERPGQRLRPGRAQLHVPQQPGRARAVQGSRTRPSSRRRSGVNDFYFGGDDFEYPDGQHPDGRQVAGRRCSAARSRCETKLAPSWTLERRRQPRGRLLALDRGPAAAREPRHARPRRQRHAQLHAEQRRAASERLFHQLKSMLGDLGHAPATTCSRATPTSRTRSRSPACAHQAGTCRFGTDPATSVLERRLPGARARQPLRRRHELLPEHRRGQPGAHRDGQRAAGRRPPARADGRAADATGARACRRMSADGARRRVVIVGGGFGGLGRRARAAARRRRRDAGRSQQPPPVPAAALPGGRRRPLRRRVRRADPRDAPAPAATRRVLMAEVDRRRRRAPPGGARPRRAARLRQPDRGLRRARRPTSATTSGARSPAA